MSRMNQTSAYLSIANDFSRYPGGRFVADSDWSGEEFREKVLAPALHDAIRQGSVLVVNLDGVAGYPSSFIEEAFGGLVRSRTFTARELEKHLRLEANPLFKTYKVMAERFIKDAKPMAAA